MDPKDESNEVDELTHPSSLYRKLFNRSLEFFLWVLEHSKPPYVVKLHVLALSLKEIKMPSMRRSIDSLVQ